jgi:hypothetical protein
MENWTHRDREEAKSEAEKEIFSKLTRAMELAVLDLAYEMKQFERARGLPERDTEMMARRRFRHFQKRLYEEFSRPPRRRRVTEDDGA